MIQRKQFLKVSAALLVVYAVLVGLFYFLAGEQLHFRNSRGNVEMLPAESGTVELAQGAVVEQSFAARIQRLESVPCNGGHTTARTPERSPWSCSKPPPARSCSAVNLTPRPSRKGA